MDFAITATFEDTGKEVVPTPDYSDLWHYQRVKCSHEAKQRNKFTLVLLQASCDDDNQPTDPQNENVVLACNYVNHKLNANESSKYIPVNAR